MIDKIKHVSKTNDLAGYDILSFNDDGSERYIEVKTTKGGKRTEFYLTANELAYSKLMKDSYNPKGKTLWETPCHIFRLNG